MNTIFITGATRGIGRETAFFFARKGWRVFGCGRDETKIVEVNTEAKRLNLALEVFRMDVTKQDEIVRGVSRLLEATEGQGIDVLVNNAGYQELGPVEDLTLETWRKQFETNLFAYIAIAQEFIPKMRERKKGRIINVSSMAGKVTFPIYGAYASSKHAVEALTDTMRMELKPFGIKVSMIEPGPMISNINITAYSGMLARRPANTAYPKYYDQAPGKLESLEKNSYPTIMVSQAIFHAATSHFPKARYRVTWIAKLAIFAKTILPASWMDFILSRNV